MIQNFPFCFFSCTVSVYSQHWAIQNLLFRSVYVVTRNDIISIKKDHLTNGEYIVNLKTIF